MGPWVSRLRMCVLWACVFERECTEHREAGSECVMESESCQTIVLQWSQGERGRAGELLGKEG